MQIPSNQPKTQATTDAGSGKASGTIHAPSVHCAVCQYPFTWDQSYGAADTPGSAPAHPPGHGTFRPRAYCPQCGALIAEWHIDRSKDYDEWVWFGDNAAANPGIALPRYPHVGRSIPRKFLPVWEEHRLNVAGVRELEVGAKAQTQKTTEVARVLAQQGYAILNPACRHGEITKAAELFESSRALGLSDDDYARAVGSIGYLYILNEGDIPRAYEYCKRSVAIAPAAYWNSHFILSLVYEGLGRRDDSARALADAQRFALTRWWEEHIERRLRATAKDWFSTHGADDFFL